MNSSKAKPHVFSTPLFRHLVFWIGVFLYFVFYMNIANYSGVQQVLEFTMTMVSLQMVTAYLTIYYFIPQFLNKKKTILFAFWLVLLLALMYSIYTFFRASYYDPKYLDYYSPLLIEQTRLSFWERLTSIPTFVSKSVKLLTPAGLLLMFRFYKNQEKYLKLSEQKKIAELTALRHQLNPHFLFNTLNNLYALSIKKSDQAPEVIEKLSDILDYMLYRCKDTFVPLSNEIELIKNYLTLEKLRYGKRVKITFSENIDQEVKIAPLLLLVFIENAFKHGVTQELKEALISIEINAQNDQINFSILNSKTKLKVEQEEKSGIGLSNVKKQIELLYGSGYSLSIDDSGKTYGVTLKFAGK